MDRRELQAFIRNKNFLTTEENATVFLGYQLMNLYQYLKTLFNIDTVSAYMARSRRED